MNRFDWRWIGAIAVIILLTQITRMPWFLMAAFLAGGGAYFLWIGWNAWQGGGGSGFGGKRVTYWRGQRIEMAPRRGPSRPRGGPAIQALVFLILGGVLVLAAGSMLFERLF